MISLGFVAVGVGVDGMVGVAVGMEVGVLVGVAVGVTVVRLALQSPTGPLQISSQGYEASLLIPCHVPFTVLKSAAKLPVTINELELVSTVNDLSSMDHP